MLLFPAAPNQIPSSGIWALALSPLPDRNGRKLVDDRAERHAGRSTSGNVLVNGYTNPYTGAEIPPTNRARSRTLQSSRTFRQIPKTSLYGNRRPKNERSFHTQTGGCRAGKFGEMREVWREKDTLRKGVLLPPRSSRAPPRSSPAPPRSSYPFLRIYLRTRATARRASGIRIAKTMIQTTKTVTETFRRADGRTCDSPIGYCRSSPASHERIAAV